MFRGSFESLKGINPQTFASARLLVVLVYNYLALY